jgi:hypothetical protein
MNEFPFVQDLNDPRDFDDAVEWASCEFSRDEFTWKGIRFFFWDREAWMLFTLRWA